VSNPDYSLFNFNIMLNKVILIGNVGQDPKVKYIDSGVAVASFTLATNETYKGKNGEKTTQTEWHNIVIWRGLAETVEKYVKKGDRLYIEGRLRHRSYEQDGVKKYITEVYGDSMVMLGGNRDQRSGTDHDPVSNPPQVDDSIPEADDLPF
jgi:single-strand DNA-binding protein